MSKKLQKSLSGFLAKIKKTSAPNLKLTSKSLSSSTSWMLRCKHARTVSFHNHDDGGATLADIDQFLFENFKSLYSEHDGQGAEKNGGKDGGEEDEEIGFFFELPELKNSPPNLGGCNRFFVEFGPSSSLMEEARSPATIPEGAGPTFATTGKSASASSEVEENAIIVVRYSRSPCDDFRKSMEEMIATQERYHGKVDWKFLEEILFSYLDLNDRDSHKFIISAFSNLVVTLQENSAIFPAVPRQLRSTSGGRKRSG